MKELDFGTISNTRRNKTTSVVNIKKDKLFSGKGGVIDR